MAGYSAELWMTILHNGFNPIPIKPDEKYPWNLKYWQNRQTTEADIEDWQKSKPGAGIGITCGEVVLMDLDIRDPDVADEEERHIDQIFEFGSVRIGAFPKRGIMFRTDKPFPKVSSRVWIDHENRKNQLEILGTGQQFVAYHIHPETKKPYEWIGKGIGPRFQTVASLITVTQEQCQQACRDFDARCKARGWTLQGSSSSTQTEPDDDDPFSDVGFDDAEPQEERPSDVSFEQLKAYLDLIPNDDGVTYESSGNPDVLSWLDVIMAVHHHVGEDGRDIAYEWSTRNPKHEDEKFNKSWGSFGKPRPGRPVTVRYIIKWANHFKEKADARPTIIVQAGRLHELATEAEQALIDQDAPIYVRAQQLVRPVVESVDASKGRRTKSARLTEVTADGLVDHLSKVAKWGRFDMKQKKNVRIDPPKQIASTLLSRDGLWKLPRLVGVITTQTIRPDGSLFLEPGYDPTTQLLLLEPPTLPAIPDKPTKRDAREALELLDSLLDEFPFAEDGGASRAVALSCLITPVVRGCVARAPLHIVRAPTPGSGKSYLVDVASTIVSGRICPVIAAGKTEEETEKRLGSILLSGQPLISIDNLNGELDGDFICQVIERPLVQIRILGRSETPVIESRATVFATGNNLIVKADMVRRTVVCDLDPNVERPELRQFESNPVDRIQSDRGRYIAAALTIVRAYIAAGCPNPVPTLASFEDWSLYVASALVWLGRADIIATIEKSREDDPDTTVMRMWVDAWKAEIGIGIEHAKGASEILALAAEGAVGGDTEYISSAVAATGLGQYGREPSAKGLGNWLAHKRGRVISGHKLMSTKNSKTKNDKWYFQRV